MANPKTLSEALCELYKLRGVADLQDPAKLSALFVDIAPNLKAERAQLEVLIKSGCLKKLAATAGMSATERKPVIDASVVTLCNVYLLDSKKAEALCRTYAYALNGKPYPPKGSTPSGGNTSGGSNTNKAGGTGGGSKSGGTSSGGKTNGGSSGGKASGVVHGGGNSGPGPVNYGGGNNTNKAGGGTNGGNKVGGTPNGGNKAGSNAPITTQKPSGCGTGLIILFLSAIAFFIAYGISVGSNMATPEANAAIVAVIVAFVAWAIAKSKKKK